MNSYNHDSLMSQAWKLWSVCVSILDKYGCTIRWFHNFTTSGFFAQYLYIYPIRFSLLMQFHVQTLIPAVALYVVYLEKNAACSVKLFVCRSLLPFVWCGPVAPPACMVPGNISLPGKCFSQKVVVWGQKLDLFHTWNVLYHTYKKLMECNYFIWKSL